MEDKNDGAPDSRYPCMISLVGGDTNRPPGEGPAVVIYKIFGGNAEQLDNVVSAIRAGNPLAINLEALYALAAIRQLGQDHSLIAMSSRRTFASCLVQNLSVELRATFQNAYYSPFLKFLEGAEAAKYIRVVRGPWPADLYI